MNAARVSASIVLEAAPLSVTPSADVILRQQRAMVVPDLVGASGAIIAAHVEWSANLEKKQLHKRDVEAALEKSIPVAIDAVFERTQRDQSSLRSAAYCIAVERVARTERLRGI
jgi:glutamate dehydrogenase (NAD(P)+)